MSQACAPSSTISPQDVSRARVAALFDRYDATVLPRLPGKRAEALDATVYALAARQLVGMSLDRREADLASVTLPEKAPAVIKSAWLNR